MIIRKITDWSTVFQNADQVDLSPDKLIVLRNMKPEPGKLVKTSECGLLLDGTLAGMNNLVTFVETNLSGGRLYIAVVINVTTRLVTVYGWNDVAWTVIQNILGNFTGNGSSWFARYGTNPIIKNDSTLRFLPGPVDKPDGTNEAAGIWLGRIDRKYFDELYSPSAGFYNYKCPLDAPGTDFGILQHHGDGAFSRTEGGIPITNLSIGDDTVTIAGEYIAVFTPGKLFVIEDNTTNYGVYKVDHAIVDQGQTVIEIDTAYLDFAGTEISGSVRATTERDTRHYRFSHMYDGIQESLLSEAIKVEFEPEKFLQLYFNIVKANHNKRITALNVYRADTVDGDYRKVQVIDFMRSAGDVTTGADGFYSGERAIYLPLMNGVTSSGSVATIKLWNRNKADWDTFDIAAMGSSDTRVIFTTTADVHSRGFSDYWDEPWQYLNNGVDITTQGTDSGFGGRRIAVIGTDVGSEALAGSVIIGKYVAATQSSGYHRIIDANKLRALHLTADIKVGAGAPADENWRLLRNSKGLYFAAEYGDSNNAGYMFFDTDLTGRLPHPLEDEVSIKINGNFERVIGNRLFGANPVLDPGGKGEVRSGWGYFSEPMQYDSKPVSNVFPLPDNEGGPVTGLWELEGDPIYLKRQALFWYKISDSPGNPTSWRPIKAPHNIGNIAVEGSIEVLGSLYICYYDGAYRIRPNNLAESDKTPTETLKISLPIENIWKAMTPAQKEAVTTSYNQKKGEVIFTLTFTIQSTDYTQHWAYNISTGNWREIYTTVGFDLTALDEHADVLVYDSTSSKVYSLAVTDTSTRSTMRIPVFKTSSVEPRQIETVIVTYQSASDLQLNLYYEHAAAPSKTVILPATAVPKTEEIRVAQHAQFASLEITEDFSGYLIIAETPITFGYLIVSEEGGVNPNTEIHELEIHHE